MTKTTDCASAREARTLGWIPKIYWTVGPLSKMYGFHPITSLLGVVNDQSIL